ncbi:hypothetical protein GDO81_022852 [Engystomops pustulosus]|uniref:Uncharacterized protein n=1 Tax=Engystomops pustulosus TaxID=76066 RepID=A0AAV6YTN2_ENGPU|nr:hypothetical protein GDO81_022852 [Engystomops pustulosus]
MSAICPNFSQTSKEQEAATDKGEGPTSSPDLRLLLTSCRGRGETPEQARPPLYQQLLLLRTQYIPESSITHTAPQYHIPYIIIHTLHGSVSPHCMWACYS